MPSSVAATFVEPRGRVHSIVAATAGREVLAVRSAKVDKGRLAGVLEVAFEDGSAWAFDVPKVHLSGAQQIAREVAGG